MENNLQNKVIEDHMINLHLNNPILLRTKLYICRNKNCNTHKKPQLKKAVLFKENNKIRKRYDTLPKIYGKNTTFQVFFKVCNENLLIISLLNYLLVTAVDDFYFP